MNQNHRNEVPLVYLYLHKKLKERFNCFKEVKYSAVMEIIKRTVYQIPKGYHNIILKELEGYNLIKKINTQRYEILEFDDEGKLKKFEQYAFW